MSTVLLSHTLYEENGKLLVSSWYKNNSIIEEDGDGNYYHPTWEEIIPFTDR